jgi:hypothetical protein
MSNHGLAVDNKYVTRLKWPGKTRPALPHAEMFHALAVAFATCDGDEYVSYLAEDVFVSPPGFIIGHRELRGREQVRAAFAEFALVLSQGRRLGVSNRRYFIDRRDESRLLLVVELTITPESGDELDTFGTEAALLLTMTGDKVSRIDSWQTEAEGLAQLEYPMAIDA